jgi:hypothetical protein
MCFMVVFCVQQSQFIDRYNIHVYYALVVLMLGYSLSKNHEALVGYNTCKKLA